MAITTYYTSISSFKRRMNLNYRTYGFNGPYKRKEFEAWQEKAVEKLSTLLGMETIENDAGNLSFNERREEMVKLENKIMREHTYIDTEEDVTMPLFILHPSSQSKGTFIAYAGHNGAGKESVAGIRDNSGVREKIEKYNYDYGLSLAEMGYTVICPDPRGFGERREKATQGDEDAQIIGQFRVAYPGVTVKIKEDTAEPLMRSLQDGSIDMAIMPIVDNSSILEGSLLLQIEPLVMALPESWVQDKPKEETGSEYPHLTVETLKDKPWVLSRGDTTIRKLENQCFEKIGIKPNVVSSLNSHMGALLMAKNGVGGTFVPLNCAIKTEGVRFFMPVPEVHWHVVISFKRDYHLHKSEKYFVSLVQDHFSKKERIGGVRDGITLS